MDEEAEDRLQMDNGAVLLGTIERIGSSAIRLWTDYAGVLEVERSKLQSLRSRHRFTLLPKEGEQVEGILILEEETGRWSLLSGEESILLTEEDLLALSLRSETADEGQAASMAVPDKEASPPVARTGKTAGAEKKSSFFLDYFVPPLPEGWSLEGGFNLNGKTGNSKSFDVEFHLAMEWERDFDRLNAYGRYAYGTSNEVRSSDEIVLGGRYTNFIFDRLGFFVREELERDQFENIALRSTSALGLSYRWYNTESLRIELRGGFSYRYEDFEDDGSRDIPGMDFGMDVNWQLADWIRFKGTYTFLPAVDDTGNFIVEQDSGVNLPLSRSQFWKMRFGISSQYNSRPDGNRERTDHRYYARIIASWE